MDAEWIDLSARAALVSHRLVGWMYWDPDAIRAFSELGVPDGFGWYITSRGAPLLGAGHQALTAAFATINGAFIEACVNHVLPHTTPEAIMNVRNEAAGAGLQRYTPEICPDLAEMAPGLWEVADRLPSFGRVLFAAHRQAPRPGDELQSAWCAINTLREWRGDTHFAVLVANDVDATMAGILDDARRNYGGWIPRSRGADDSAIARAMERLTERGYATNGQVNQAGLVFRDELEAQTDQITASSWQIFGKERTRLLIELIEPVGDRLVERIDATAGPEWMPAARKIKS